MNNYNNRIFALTKKLEKEWQLDASYKDLYAFIIDDDVKILLSSLQSFFIHNFEILNQRLPTKENTNHFRAENSRSLIKNIELAKELLIILNMTSQPCQFDKYNEMLIFKCNGFLRKSNGSIIPANMEEIEIYYKIPMFELKNSIVREDLHKTFNLQHIGSGSYADVMYYWDDYYDIKIAVKRAHKNLTTKEIERFKKEFKIMKELDYPYLLKVYSYDEIKNQYTMEYMDTTLYDYMKKNNAKLNRKVRLNIIGQIFKAFSFLHSKEILHRDISPLNILLKLYSDIIVVKVSDFGLVKIIDSKMTSESSELKGCFNDPNLRLEGFSNYDIQHETYALTRLIVFVWTGKTNYEKIKDVHILKLLEKGLNPNKNLRFKSVEELKNEFYNTINN